jgi:hypothetical protein
MQALSHDTPHFGCQVNGLSRISVQSLLYSLAGQPLLRWSEPPSQQGQDRSTSHDDGCIIQRLSRDWEDIRRVQYSNYPTIPKYCNNLKRFAETP